MCHIFSADKKIMYFIIAFIWNNQNKYIYGERKQIRERKQISHCQGLVGVKSWMTSYYVVFSDKYFIKMNCDLHRGHGLQRHNCNKYHHWIFGTCFHFYYNIILMWYWINKMFKCTKYIWQSTLIILKETIPNSQPWKHTYK